MEAVILVIHLLVAAALIGVVLIQKSEGGLGGMGGGATMGGVMSSRGAANLLTRATAVLATAFMITSLLLAIMAQRDDSAPSFLDAPAAASAPPAEPAEPQAPVAPTR